MDRFDGRVCVITGAGAGIGQAAAMRVAAEGGSVVIADRDGDAGEATAAAIQHTGGIAISIRTDVSVPEQVENLIAHTMDHFGKIDVLANNAGVAVHGSVTSLSLDEWERVMNTNLRSIWLTMKFAIPHMIEGRSGSIVNMSSAQALLGFPGWAGYASTKGAIISLTQQAAVEYAPLGIRVNAVAPGTIWTPMNEKIFAEASDPVSLSEAWGSQHALGRFGQAEEVAAAIAFLASDDASFITGVCLPVDGGMRILGPTASAG